MAFGLTWGANKLREALAETGDLDVIAAGMDHLAKAYMDQLRDLENLPSEETGYHKGVRLGLRKVGEFLREAVTLTPDFHL